MFLLIVCVLLVSVVNVQFAPLLEDNSLGGPTLVRANGWIAILWEILAIVIRPTTTALIL
jgi:hypothetical protein